MKIMMNGVWFRRKHAIPFLQLHEEKNMLACYGGAIGILFL